MPVTFFAHQAPVLPIIRRWPHRVDGLALVIGSMSPDFAFALKGTGFSLWAHKFPEVLTFCVPVTVVASWCIARVMAPVVPDHLPDIGQFRLPDFRGLTTHKLRWFVTPISAFVGALTHVGLDSFTHKWGWFAQHWDWYSDPFIPLPFIDRTITPYRSLQYLGHVVLTAWVLRTLWRNGQQQWFTKRANTIPRFQATTTTHLILWVPAATATTLNAIAQLARPSAATGILTTAGIAFASLTASSTVLLVTRPAPREPVTPISHRREGVTQARGRDAQGVHGIPHQESSDLERCWL
jgi:Domain of unknown function (DUF4184)